MDLGLFGGWGGMLGAPVEAVVLSPYAVLVLRLAGKTTVGTTRIFDFVSTVAMGTIIGSTIISKSIALTTGLVGLTALVALQWSVAYASSRSGRFYRITTNTPRLLYDSSHFLDSNLKAERITREDVLAKIRETGPPNLGSVAAVVLETTGNVAVIGSSVPRSRSPRRPPVGPHRVRCAHNLVFTAVLAGRWSEPEVVSALV